MKNDTPPLRRRATDLPPESYARWADTGLGETLAPAALLLGRLVLRRLEHALVDAGLGLTPAQARAVGSLWLHGPTTQQELATHTEVEPSTIVRTLDVMERDGIARREKNPSDRRAYLVRLTARGERLVPRLVALWDEVERDLVEGMTPGEVAAARELVARMIDRLGSGDAPGCG